MKRAAAARIRTNKGPAAERPDPEDFPSLKPTNPFGERSREMLCSGVATTGACSMPKVDQRIERDPDGRIIDLQDGVVQISGRRTFYRDCSLTIDQYEGLFPGGYGDEGANIVSPLGEIRRDLVEFDPYGNVEWFNRTGPEMPAISVTQASNAQNQVIDCTLDPGGMFAPTYDPNGNLASTGDGRRYAYDALNNLTHVYEDDGEGEILFARFWYNAAGRRIAAAYNEFADSETGDAVFDNDRVEFFAYDDLWRLRAVYARDPGQTTATCRERYAYNPAGLNGKPTSAPLDSPVFGQIDEAGDGTFERSFLIIQNHLGDVIKIIGEGGFDEEIRYTLFGEPYIVNWYADVNHDGGVDGEDIIAFYALWDNGDGLADLDGQNGVDGDDVILFFEWWDAGQGDGLTLSDNRFGFRGYVWDDRLQLYHVRHRVYDPTPGPAGMRWLQRDPAFFVDGLNLYAYCAGDPVNGRDPFGLQSEPPTEDDRGFIDWVWEGVKSIFSGDPGGATSNWQAEGENRRQEHVEREHSGEWSNPWGDSSIDYELSRQRIRQQNLTLTAALTGQAINLAVRTAFAAGDFIEGVTEAGHQFSVQPTIVGGAVVAIYIFIEMAPGENPVRLVMREGETIEQALKRHLLGEEEPCLSTGGGGGKYKASKKAAEKGGEWTGSPKHHENSPPGIGKAPSRPELWEHASQIKETSPRRITYDRENGEIVVFDYDNSNGWHGHVRTWESLDQTMKNILIRDGHFKPTGKPKR